MVNIEVDTRSDCKVDIKYHGDCLILSTDEEGINKINIKFGLDNWEEIIESSREQLGEKTYKELEEAYLQMEAEKEELENELECLREANEILRRR